MRRRPPARRSDGTTSQPLPGRARRLHGGPTNPCSTSRRVSTAPPCLLARPKAEAGQRPDGEQAPRRSRPETARGSPRSRRRPRCPRSTARTHLDVWRRRRLPGRGRRRAQQHDQRRDGRQVRSSHDPSSALAAITAPDPRPAPNRGCVAAYTQTGLLQTSAPPTNSGPARLASQGIAHRPGVSAARQRPSGETGVDPAPRGSQHARDDGQRRRRRDIDDTVDQPGRRSDLHPEPRDHGFGVLPFWVSVPCGACGVLAWAVAVSGTGRRCFGEGSPRVFGCGAREALVPAPCRFPHFGCRHSQPAIHRQEFDVLFRQRRHIGTCSRSAAAAEVDAALWWCSVGSSIVPRSVSALELVADEVEQVLGI